MSRKAKAEKADVKGCLLQFLPLVMLCFGLPAVYFWSKFEPTSTWGRVESILGFGVVSFIMLMVPYGDQCTKLKIRRFCKKRGLTLIKIKVTRRTYGVTYLDKGEQKYGRWPEDFPELESTGEVAK